MSKKPDRPGLDRTLKYYDEVADTYLDLYQKSQIQGAGLRVRRRLVLDLLDQPGCNVLDVGRGPGVMVADLLARDCRFWGVDPSFQMIEQASNMFSSRSRARFAVGLAEELSFPDGEFDAVLCMGVLGRTQDRQRALREMLRVLRPGGTLIVALSSKWSAYFIWREYVFYPVVSLLRPVYYGIRGRARPPVLPRRKRFDARRFCSELEAQGCTVLNVVHFGFNFLLPPLDRLFPRLALGLMNRLEAIRSERFRRFGAGFIVKAGKL